MSLACKLSSGEMLELARFDGKLLTFKAPRAVAPGVPLRVQVQPRGPTLELKSIGSRKCDDGGFELRARIMTMPKAVRDTLRVHFEV